MLESYDNVLGLQELFPSLFSPPTRTISHGNAENFLIHYF